MAKATVKLSLGLAVAGFMTVALAQSGTGAERSYTIYRLGGNEFIIRKMPAGRGRIYLYAYRAAGDQWERHSIAIVPARGKRRGNSIPERVYYKGRRIGSIRVDLDNPLNTDLNRSYWP
jgi:hypothetical protein